LSIGPNSGEASKALAIPRGTESSNPIPSSGESANFVHERRTINCAWAIREGKEIVCPKGTLCDCNTRDASDQITDGDFCGA
jgi:hypothetical protein